MHFESREFFEYYEAAHQNRTNRYIHHFAHSLAAIGLILLPFRPVLGLACIPIAFALSWIGHYIFEKNTPAFFETDKLESRSASAAHHAKVAVGGVVWTFVCFLRLFGFGPLAE